MEILAEILTQRELTIQGPVEVIEIDDGTDDDFSGWYCIETDDWPCPQCGTIVKFATARHLIIVWDEKDHPAMLKLAQACKEVGRNPRIVEYEETFGPAISWYAFDQGDSWQAHWNSGT